MTFANQALPPDRSRCDTQGQLHQSSGDVKSDLGGTVSSLSLDAGRSERDRREGIGALPSRGHGCRCSSAVQRRGPAWRIRLRLGSLAAVRAASSRSRDRVRCRYRSQPPAAARHGRHDPAHTPLSRRSCLRRHMRMGEPALMSLSDGSRGMSSQYSRAPVSLIDVPAAAADGADCTASRCTTPSR